MQRRGNALVSLPLNFLSLGFGTQTCELSLYPGLCMLEAASIIVFKIDRRFSERPVLPWCSPHQPVGDEVESLMLPLSPTSMLAPSAPFSARMPGSREPCQNILGVALGTLITSHFKNGNYLGLCAGFSVSEVLGSTSQSRPPVSPPGLRFLTLEELYSLVPGE